MSSKWEKMAQSVVAIFSNDDTLDMKELDYLLHLALEDEEMDEKEKNVLRGIFNQLNEDHVDSLVWEKVQSVKKKYDIN